MDIEKLIGVEIESLEGVTIGEIVGIELFGGKINIIVASEFDFEDGGPDGDDGLPYEIDDAQPDLFNEANINLSENVLRLHQTG